MSIENKSYHFRTVCAFCGAINHDHIPIPSKDVTAKIKCKDCNKFLIDFHEAEK